MCGRCGAIGTLRAVGCYFRVMRRRSDKPAPLILSAVFALCLVGACEEPRSITVEPNPDLIDGTEVTVTLRGYEPNTEQEVTQCIARSAWQCGERIRVPIGADGSARAARLEPSIVREVMGGASG
jgi:hypothetical protein